MGNLMSEQDIQRLTALANEAMAQAAEARGFHDFAKWLKRRAAQ